MIVKVQRPVASSGDDGPVLIYDQPKELHKMVPMTPEIAKLFADRYKIFCEARVDGDSIYLIKVVPDRGW